MRRRDFLVGTAGALAAASGATAHASRGWPDRPVKIIVPWPPGGATDVLARPWAEQLSRLYGQPFVIENRSGAGGLVGNEAATKAAPDGYTLLITSRATLTVLPHLRKTPYDPVKSFTPIGQVGNFVCGFVINPAAGPKTFPEMIDYAKRNPGKLSYGSAGLGTTTHLRIEILKQKAGVDILHIPYRGGAESLADVLANTANLMNEPTTLSHVKAGRLTLLNVNHATRSPDFPDVPTLTELGYPDADMPLSFGLYGPAGIPGDIVQDLNARMRELAGTAEMKAKLWSLSAIAALETPEQMAASTAADDKINRELIAAAKIQLE